MNKFVFILFSTTIALCTSLAVAQNKVVVVPLQKCADGFIYCRGKCVDTANNPFFCGDCNTDCGVNGFCSTGVCRYFTGQPCITSTECATGYCVDGICCDKTCSAACESCEGTNTGGKDGYCAKITAMTDPGNDCAGSSLCGVSGSCGKPYGESCTTGSECASGFCVDGLCCDTECSSTCKSCKGVNTGGADGICSNTSNGLDPDGECGWTHYCNGNGGCQSCSDETKNGLEDDVDCGHPACGVHTCDWGQSCDDDLDCGGISQRCRSPFCEE